MYYLRSTAAADAIKFTLDKSALAQPTEAKAKVEADKVTVTEPIVAYASKEDYDQKRSDMACSLDNPDACEACGS